MMLVPALLLALAILVRDPLGSALGFAPHHGEGMEYANLFPHWLLIGFFSFFWGVAVLLAMIGVLRFWKTMKAADLAEGRKLSGKGVLASAVDVFRDIITHRRFGKCASKTSQFTAHFSAFYGFVVLFLVSVWAVILLYFINPFVENPFAYPFPFWNPAKIIANLGALALVVGCLLAVFQRLKDDLASGKSSEFDWLFLGILLTVGVTGIFTELFRFLQAQTVGYVVYFIHLIFAFMLLVYLPYSKFAHIMYRTVALVYAEYSGRNQAKEAAREAA
jgi:quinone-modifying oxidoreductase subunit QmoC